MLLFVKLLKVDQRVLVLRIESQYLVERLQRAVNEPAALVVESQTQQHVRVLKPADPRPLQQALVNRDRLADLSLLAVQVAENQVHFERVGVQAGGSGQFIDCEIDLVGDQEVQAEQVMGRLASAAPVEPLAVAQRVSL